MRMWHLSRDLKEGRERAMQLYGREVRGRAKRGGVGDEITEVMGFQVPLDS